MAASRYSLALTHHPENSHWSALGQPSRDRDGRFQQTRRQAGSAEFAGFELRGLQTGNRRKAAEFLRIETLRYLASRDPRYGSGVGRPRLDQRRFDCHAIMSVAGRASESAPSGGTGHA